MTAGQRAVVKKLFFVFFMLPMTILLWNTGAFQLMWNMGVMLCGAIVNLLVIFWSFAWHAIF